MVNSASPLNGKAPLLLSPVPCTFARSILFLTGSVSVWYFPAVAASNGQIPSFPGVREAAAAAKESTMLLRTGFFPTFCALVSLSNTELKNLTDALNLAAALGEAGMAKRCGIPWPCLLFPGQAAARDFKYHTDIKVLTLEWLDYPF